MRCTALVALVAFALPLCVVDLAPARAAAGAPPSLAGLWRLDPTRSDLPRGPRGPGRPGAPGDGAGAGQRDAPGPPDAAGREGKGDRGQVGPGMGGPGGHRPGRLPELLRITQKDGMLALADSSGTVLQEIVIDGRAARPPASGSTILELAGHWKDGQLVVERTGWRGNTAIDSWSLGEGGKTLTVDTKMSGGDALPGFQMKRVYVKVG